MFGVTSRKNLADDTAMDKKLFQELIGALKDATAFERGEKIGLRVAKLPPPPKPMPAKEII